MKLIAISQRQDDIAARHETRDALDQALCRWVIAAGFLPVAIPNGLAGPGEEDNDPLANWLRTLNPAGLILSGGNDIGCTPARDLTETRLLAWARQYSLPTLAICRGMQFMGLDAGASLIAVTDHAGTRHTLSDGRQVNSYHHYALATVPSGFLAEAHSPDGSLEAMRHAELPWLGWMWHPERETPFDPQDLSRFRKLFA